MTIDTSIIFEVVFPMRCVYCSGDECAAAPKQDLYYKPSEEELKRFCESENFKNCPRLQAFQDHLRVQSRP